MPIRTKLRDRTLPNYSRSEELFHMISHAAGGVFAIVVLTITVSMAAVRGDTWNIASCAVYGATMIILYAMSSLYHGLTHQRVKNVLRIFDHCAINFLIAGTFTPYIAIGLRPAHPNMVWPMLGFIWGICLLCAVFTAIDLQKFRIVSVVGYLALGLALILMANPLLDTITPATYLFILLGVAVYVIGSVLYQIGKRKKWMHAVFHLVVLAGSALHFVSVVLCLG